MKPHSPEEIKEGEECFVGETDSKGNTVQYNSHVPYNNQIQLIISQQHSLSR